MIESVHRLVLMASIVGLIVSCSDGAPTVLAPGTRTPATGIDHNGRVDTNLIILRAAQYSPSRGNPKAAESTCGATTQARPL
jgi:hypothetical protein